MSIKKSKIDTTAEVPTEALEMPTEAVEFAQKSVDQVKVVFEKATDVAEKATEVAQDNVQVLEAVASAYKSGVVDFQKKAMEFAQKNMEQAFAFSRKLFSTKEFGEVVSLQQSFVKDQAEAFKTQAGELNEIAVRLSSETTKPLQNSFAKSFKDFSKSFAA
jgi:phasin family protein